MVKLRVVYEGDLHTVVTHLPSGQMLHTDAPKDNQGKGETFSPTDLVAAALASCIATVLALYGEKKGWDLRALRVEVEKTMSQEGARRIERLAVELFVPIELSEEERKSLERVAHTCPVEKSLHPDVKVSLAVYYP